MVSKILGDSAWFDGLQKNVFLHESGRRERWGENDDILLREIALRICWEHSWTSKSFFFLLYPIYSIYPITVWGLTLGSFLVVGGVF